jgi:hypothetical protein
MMPDVAHTPLAAWESFYVIVGSSAAALTGLQFVVMALIADSNRRGTSAEVATFGTPTVVHFCAALLIAAIVSAPWTAITAAGIAIGCIGAAGLVYVGLIIRGATRTQRYRPVLEDWIWHAVLPFLSYGCLFGAALALSSHPITALFVVAAASLMLVLIGIHNAWDSVAYVAIEMRQPDKPA